MTDQQVIEHQARLLAQADEEGRTAEWLSDNYFAVQSKHRPIARHVIRIDGNSGFTVSCSGVDPDESECTGMSVKGWCLHGLLAQRLWDELRPEPDLYELLTKSVEACKRIEANSHEDLCPMDPERVDSAPPEFEYRREAEAKAAAAEDHARLAPVPATHIPRVNGRPELFRRPGGIHH